MSRLPESAIRGHRRLFVRFGRAFFGDSRETRDRPVDVILSRVELRTQRVAVIVIRPPSASRRVVTEHARAAPVIAKREVTGATN